jgi:hypothetical protein
LNEPPLIREGDTATRGLLTPIEEGLLYDPPLLEGGLLMPIEEGLELLTLLGCGLDTLGAGADDLEPPLLGAGADDLEPPPPPPASLCWASAEEAINKHNSPLKAIESKYLYDLFMILSISNSAQTIVWYAGFIYRLTIILMV